MAGDWAIAAIVTFRDNAALAIDRDWAHCAVVGADANAANR